MNASDRQLSRVLDTLTIIAEDNPDPRRRFLAEQLRRALTRFIPLRRVRRRGR